MQLTHKLKLYLKFYEISEEDGLDPKIQDDALAKLEELYYELTPEEIAYLEEKEIV